MCTGLAQGKHLIATGLGVRKLWEHTPEGKVLSVQNVIFLQVSLRRSQGIGIKWSKPALLNSAVPCLQSVQKLQLKKRDWEWQGCKGKSSWCYETCGIQKNNPQSFKNIRSSKMNYYNNCNFLAAFFQMEASVMCINSLEILKWKPWNANSISEIDCYYRWWNSLFGHNLWGEHSEPC